MKTLREGLAALGVLAAAVIVAMNYSHLPERIATHFNAVGVADGFGSKSTLWFLVVLAVVSYAMMSLINLLPPMVNVGKPLTPEQLAVVWGSALDMVGWIKTEMALLFAYLCYAMVEIAQGARAGLGPDFTPAILIVTSATLLVFGLRMWWAVRKF